MSEVVRYEIVEDWIALVTIDRPEKRNAVNVDTDTVTFQPANVVSGITATVEAAFAITRAAAGAGCGR